MNRCPHTCFSTQFHTGKGLLRARLRDLYAPARAWGRAPLALVLFLTLAAGSLAACAPAEPVPTSTWTPDTVPADTMGEVLDCVQKALPAETAVDWQAETGQGRAGLLTAGEQTWVVIEDRDGPHLAEVLTGLTEAALQPFTGILGADGYTLDYNQSSTGDYRIYYDAAGVPLALSFGFGRQDTPVDLDGDGIRELVCSVTYMADGVPAVLVYRLSEGEIWQAEASALPEDVYQDRPPANGPPWTSYDPETNTITTSLQFPGEEERQSWTTELDLDALEFYPYQY